MLEKAPKDRPDTLTLADRFSLRTNTLDWLLLLPNISAEFDLGCYDYNHWAVGMGFRYNWQTKHHFKPAQVYNLAEVRGEVRYYWHTQKIDTTASVIKGSKKTRIYSHREKDYWKRLWSTRRFMPKHLNTTYYRGAYIAYDKYSLLLGQTGRQGKAIQAGFLYGVVKPLYEFKNGNTLDLDLGISAGLCFASYDKYYNDRESDCYPVMGHQDWSIVPFPLINELRFAFVYRFGDYPMPKKYRWRYEVDQEYRDSINAIIERKLKEADSIAKEEANMKFLRQNFDEYWKKAYENLKNDSINLNAPLEKTEVFKTKAKAVKADKSKKEKTPKVEKAKKEKTPKEEKPKKEKKSKKDKKKESAEETPVTSESSDNQESPATQDSTDNKETQETPEQPQKEKTPENED